jgi:hypothetical protein
MFLGLDHLVIAVADPDDAAAQLEADLGLELPVDDVPRTVQRFARTGPSPGPRPSVRWTCWQPS